MNSLLPLALLVLAPAFGLDVCDACKAGKVCKPHAELEKTELAALRAALESSDERERIAALRDVAALTDEHENVPSKAVAEILVAALEDPSLRVRSRALRLLGDGQHPETTVLAVVRVLKGFTRNMWGLVPWLTGPDGERGTTEDAMTYLETSMRVAGGLPDDRVVGALADVLVAMPTEMRGEPVAMAATRSLLDLGSRDAVSAVLRQLQPWSESPRMRKVHDALEGFAQDHELEDAPEFEAEAGKAWGRWFRKHSRSLPAKLGKWRGRVDDEDEDDGGVFSRSGVTSRRPPR